MPTAAAKPAKESLLVTSDELVAIRDAEKKFSDAKKKLADAEREVKLLRLTLAEKVLGIKTEDELKMLSPVHVAKLYAKRLENGDWKPQRNTPAFAFSKTNEGRYPAWAKLYALELGEVRANQVKAETDLTYSYCVEVAQPA